jgi:hypothetical protein
MSWFSQNYDKALLGVAFATLAGVVGSSFIGTSTTSTNTKVAKEGETYPWDGLKEKLAKEAADLASPAAQGAQIWQAVKIDQNRTASLFQGPALVQRPGVDALLDVLDPASEKIRGDVPNAWFLENGLDITRSKILERDEDSDKFSNLEEFLGGSNPRDPNSTPSAVLKLKLAEVVALKCELKFKVSGPEFQIRRTREDEAGKDPISRSNLNAKIGEPIFGADENSRFKLEAVTDETVGGKPSKVAKVSDAVVTTGSPFTIAEGTVVDRPIQTAKIECNMDGVEQKIVKEGEGFAFKAFPSIKFKLVKIEADGQTIQVEYSEAGKASKLQPIKKK